MAMKSVFREDQSVAPTLVRDVMAQFAVVVNVAVDRVYIAQRREATSLDFTVNYPGVASVVVGAHTVSHQKGALWS